ncbi:MAG: HIT family protein [Candidatus Micrarchaeota archaeon]|nr:HIT family protein [Candidatus Micrarchaeota archaeon]
MKKCAFCNFQDKQVVIYQDSLCFAIISKDPINRQHVLIVTKKHYQGLAEVPAGTAAHIFLVAKKMSKAVEKACKPDAITCTFDDDFSNGGFNLVQHFKIHLIPRFRKDRHLIDWSPLRVRASAKLRSRFAEEVKRRLG